MAQEPVPAASTPQPRYSITTTPIGVPAIPSTVTGTASGHWEGDTWIEPDGYRVDRKWVGKYQYLYGPLATDPDGGLGDVELDDNLARALRKIDGYGGIGSTSAERHCAETAAYIAWNFVESSSDIPPVPKFWIGEAHYWFMTITAIRQVKKKNLADSAMAACTSLMGLMQNRKVLGAITAALAAGGVVLPPFVQALLKIIGGT
jgi:hypothetical protein